VGSIYLQVIADLGCIDLLRIWQARHNGIEKTLALANQKASSKVILKKHQPL